MIKTSLKELETQYDNLAREWLNAVRIGDELSLEVAEAQIRGVEKKLASFEV